jgi:hypothetical protein
MSELVAALLVWIAGQTGLAVPPAPSVEFLPREKISERAFGRRWQAGDDIRGLYDGKVATVFLLEGWDSAELRDRSILLHELVHHVQAFHGLRYECSARREREAYEMTVKWLRSLGVADPYALMDTDEYTIVAMSACLDFFDPVPLEREAPG